MNYLLRIAEEQDLPQLQGLLNGYYQGEWRGSLERLNEHLSEKIFEITLIQSSQGKLCGFLAWIITYDTNWCMKGGDILDFYVTPEHRGRGAALMLTAGVST